MKWLIITFTLTLGFIPSSWAASNPDGVAVIIGNKTYQGQIPAVDYANNDAEAIKRYIIDILGYSSENIIDLRDATQSRMEAVFGNDRSYKGKLWSYLEQNGGSDIIVYYSGHGVPGQNDKRGYLLPVDAAPDQAEINGYPIDLLYKNLGRLKARSKTVLLDTCFSGDSPRGMLIRQASPVFIKVKAGQVGKDMTVLTAASGTQLASWDETARHGLFTEYFLRGVYGKADNNGDGSVTMAEMKVFLDDAMTKTARRTFQREQTATAVGNQNQVLASLDPAHPPSRPRIAELSTATEELPPAKVGLNTTPEELPPAKVNPQHGAPMIRGLRVHD